MCAASIPLHFLQKNEIMGKTYIEFWDLRGNAKGMRMPTLYSSVSVFVEDKMSKFKKEKPKENVLGLGIIHSGQRLAAYCARSQQTL